MSEFFRGWRRKMGVAVLVIAVILVGGWVRSGTYSDSIQLRGGERTRFDLDSENGFLFFSWITSEHAHSMRICPYFLTLYCPDPEAFYLFYLDDTVTHRLGWLAAGRRERLVNERNPDHTIEWWISYFSLILPLTLLAAYLLLSAPPRQRKMAGPPAVNGR